MSSTEELLDRHLDCFGRGDLDIEFGKPGTTFSLQLRSVDGDYAYILWRAETADNIYEAVADTFVMRNGQIILHSFGGKIQAKTVSIQ